MKNLLLYIIILITLSTYCQAPEKMSYQAVLRDNENKLLINKQIGLQISILQGEIAVYTETLTTTTNDNGLITLEIGTGNTVLGTFNTIDWSSGTYFIKTEIDPDGSNNYSISISSQILSVPYAIYSNKSGEAKNGLPNGGVSNQILKINNFGTPEWVTPEVELSQVSSILGREGKIAAQTNLIDGEIIKITDFPYHLKKGLSMSFYADLLLNGSVSFGKGYEKYRGEYLKIDTKNVYYFYDNVLQSTKPHGLFIDKFLRASFFVDDLSIAYVILQSINGTFQTTFQFNYEMNYEPFIKTDGQDLLNIKLTCTSKEFQHPVWVFGDSYLGVSPSRWVGVMKNFGFFNFMINGLAGQSSGGAFNDLERTLKYGTPKYLLWFLGMNDSYFNYNLNLEKLVKKTKELGITLILATIPTVPSRDKETISSKALTSGYRYIDFYKAVGTNSSGDWYSGYLSSDGVHPTEIGAKALAGQVLFDFPELMQYGKTF